MSTDKMVFRSVYVDPDVDRALRSQADQTGKSKGEMFRSYLQKGMAEAQKGHARTALPERDSRLALRTVYLPLDLDENLRTQAFDSRTSKSDLIRQFLRMGMMASVTQSPSTKRDKPGSITRKAVRKNEPSADVVSATTPGKPSRSKRRPVTTSRAVTSAER